MPATRHSWMARRPGGYSSLDVVGDFGRVALRSRGVNDAHQRHKGKIRLDLPFKPIRQGQKKEQQVLPVHLRRFLMLCNG